MEPVVTINLGGNAYQLDQSAYDALRAYLDRAGAALKDNPDRAEILRDLEQAIAEKCGAYLGPHKTVISASEMRAALEQMGPVEGDDGAAQNSASEAGASYEPRRKLYRVYDRHSITGVSAGLAAYAALDPALVRVIWILAVLFSGGFALIGYIALAFIMPLASSPEQVAAAHGAPFNAQEVIEEAKRRYAEFADENGAGGRAWRDVRRSWRHNAAEFRRQSYAAAPVTPVGPATRLLSGVLAFVLSLVGLALFAAFLFTIYSLLTAGSVLGWAPPATVPLWAAILGVCVAYGLIAGPLGMLQGASTSTMLGRPDHIHHGGGFANVVLIVIVGWLLYTYVPDARDFMNDIGTHMRTAIDALDAAF